MTELSKNAQVPQCDKTAVKCRFFMQYYGQEVFAFDEKESIRINSKTISYVSGESFLRLKNVSDIKDEECVELFDKFYPNATRYSPLEKIVDIKGAIRSDFSEYVIISEDFVFYTDYLRSKGYALPFMEYSVEELVKMGWVQLI